MKYGGFLAVFGGRGALYNCSVSSELLTFYCIQIEYFLSHLAF